MAVIGTERPVRLYGFCSNLLCVGLLTELENFKIGLLSAETIKRVTLGQSL
jgi:hypothetical protein